MKASKRMLVLFLTPALLAYLLIFFYPTVQTLIFSFFKLGNFSGTEMSFRGLSNYNELLKAPLFRTSLANIGKMWLIGGIAVFGLAFFFTILLTSGIKGKNFFRAIIYLPNLISVVAMTTMWTQYIYNRRYGLFATFFKAVGLEELAKIQWTSQDMLFWSMLIAFVWGSVGWFMLFLLAGVERIPIDFYEAAKLDGATMFQSFFKITLPLVRDVFRVALVMWSITIINLFAFPKTFTPIQMQPPTYTPAVYLYELAFGIGAGQGGESLQLGKAAAIGVSLLLMVIIVYVVLNGIFKQTELEY